MGTRSLTIFKEDKKDVAVMYRQFDGYPSGHGQELKAFLSEFEGVTNGIAIGETRKTANGMGCLAAQTVAHFKTGVGQFYLHAANTRDCGEQYRYTVSLSQTASGGFQIHLTVQSGYEKKWKTLFKGPVAEFDIKKAEEREDA